MASKTKFNAEEQALVTSEALEAVKTAPAMETQAVLGVLLECMAGRKAFVIRYKRDLEDGTGYIVRHRVVGPFVCLRETRKGIQLLAKDSIYQDKDAIHFNLANIEAGLIGGQLPPVGELKSKDKDGNEYKVVPMYPLSWNAARWAKSVRWVKPEEADKLKGYSTELVVSVIPFTQ